ncbi:MAG: PAS domain-containing protein [Alphaproteobacteria bacterium]|nr:PAS domain-containing protein [Alphaproteobacteria bacterium]
MPPSTTPAGTTPASTTPAGTTPVGTTPAGTVPSSSGMSGTGADSAAYLVDSNRLTEMLVDGVILANHQGAIMHVNSAAVRFLGDKLVGQTIGDVFHQDDVIDAFTKAVEQNIEEEMNFHLESEVDREFHLKFRRLNDDLVAMLLLDMTLQRNLEKVRRDFVANVSHELRSPLTSLAGFIETLLGGDVEDEATRQRFLTIMDEEAGRMSRLIDDLLSLSRVEVMEHIIPDQQVDLLNLVGSVMDTLSGMAEQRGMSIVIDDQRDDRTAPQSMLGNPDEITGVFVNLLENAIKYGRRETQVTVRITAPKPDTMLFDVINLGEGIESHHLSRLTERFYRVDKARSRQIGGTGLGLAIVKHVVNRHRGQLSVKSTLGVSTTFTVKFPTISA